MLKTSSDEDIVFSSSNSFKFSGQRDPYDKDMSPDSSDNDMPICASSDDDTGVMTLHPVKILHSTTSCTTCRATY